jgi:hypothetical protein
MIRNTAILSLFLCLSTWAVAQSASESEIPCQGTSVFAEDFEAGIPASWTVWDADGRTPQSGIGLGPGFQAFTDYTDDSNQVAVSPSWYAPGGASDDWLVTPAIALPALPCLSWRASSVDGSYPEAYEVRIATAADSAGLLSSTVVDTVYEENEAWTYHSLTLSAYAGQTVFVAFHQISDDKFVLALDDVAVTDVNSLDIGVWSMAAVVADPGDTVFLSGRVMNYGPTPVTSFTVSFQVESGLVFSTTVDSVNLTLNNGVNFTMTNSWITESLPKIYDVCLFTSLPNAATDEDINNDSICTKVNIGGAIGIEDGEAMASPKVFPNPSTGAFTVQVPQGNWKLELISLEGKLLGEQLFWGAECQVLSEVEGLCFLRLTETATGTQLHGKVILH